MKSIILLITLCFAVTFSADIIILTTEYSGAGCTGKELTANYVSEASCTPSEYTEGATLTTCSNSQVTYTACFDNACQNCSSAESTTQPTCSSAGTPAGYYIQTIGVSCGGSLPTSYSGSIYILYTTDNTTCSKNDLYDLDEIFLSTSTCYEGLSYSENGTAFVSGSEMYTCNSEGAVITTYTDTACKTVETTVTHPSACTAGVTITCNNAYQIGVPLVLLIIAMLF